MPRLPFAPLLALVLALPALAQEAAAPPAPVPSVERLFAPLDLPAPNQYRSADGRPGPAYWQNRNDYRIEAALDTTTHTLTGTVRLTYTNESPQALDYLWFHLEQNLFTPGARGASGSRAGPAVDAAHGFRLGRVTVDGAPVRPVVTDTRMRLDLAEPVAANGGRVEVVVPYSFVVPGDQTPRMGRMETARGTVYALAQWYPRVAVYDDVTGWNHMPYLGSGEFYLGYGDVELELTVPSAMTVVATGELLNEGEVFTDVQRRRLAEARRSAEAVPIVRADEVGTAAARPSRSGRTTWRYRAETVRDVAWGASTAFVLDGAVARVEQEDGGTNEVLILSAYPHEGIGTAENPGWEQATRYGRASILNNSYWLPYPYPVAISVASHIGGMEYPMLHFSQVGSRHFGLFGVVDHELGHNWFPMIVGSDERRYAWMDEGFNTFINYDSNVAFYDRNEDRSIAGYGESGRSQYVALLTPDTFVRVLDQIGERRPILTYPDRFEGNGLGVGAYFKPGMGLKVLRDAVLGPERFDSAFKAYIRRWAYKHPQPADFFRTMEDVAGEDLDWFWRGWFMTTERYDAALASVAAEDGRAVARVETRGLVMPAVVEFAFADGTTERAAVPAEAFFTSGEAAASVALGGRTLASARLDPDGVLPDVDRENDRAEVE